MGQCITVNVGNVNDGATANPSSSSNNVSVGGEEEEEEEEGCMMDCLKAAGCVICL